jgi:uncharacterized integral membrane protein
VNIISLILGLLFGVLLVLIGAQNAQPVSMHVFGWQSSSVPLVLALAAALAIGAFLAFLASIPGRIRGWHERRSLQQQLEEARRRLAIPPPPPVTPLPTAQPTTSPTDGDLDSDLDEERGTSE